ncbi:MAG: NADH:flavin oxidoreductase [Cetobacterium sp.]
MKKLFEKTQLKNLELKNRFIRSATWEAMAEKDGHLNKSIYDFYEELAQGGVGLIISTYAFISKNEQPNLGMLGIQDDSLIEEYKELVERVHKYDSKIALQIVYGGSQNDHPDKEKMEILGPSAVENIVFGVTPKEATKEDIRKIVKLFGDAALRAKKAGFDAIQIHAAHGYLLNQFLTPYYNRRKDEYGGSIHNRARIIYEVIEEIKKRVGNDYPIMIKLNYNDFMTKNKGLEEVESLEIFKKISDLGVHLIEVSGGNISSGENMATFNMENNVNSIENQSYFKKAAENIAKNVSSKVSLVGGNKNFELMQDILNTTEIEYFSLSRTLFSEPDLINKWMTNEKQRPKCVSCNHCWDTLPNSCILRRDKK